VDASQGTEADIILVSFVRSQAAGGKGRTGFLSDDRRLNVALTRARHQLICCGNARMFSALNGETLQ
jgi:superfamily I DNA and/or RNA helicase